MWFYRFFVQSITFKQSINRYDVFNLRRGQHKESEAWWKNPQSGELKPMQLNTFSLKLTALLWSVLSTAHCLFGPSLQSTVYRSRSKTPSYWLLALQYSFHPDDIRNVRCDIRVPSAGVKQVLLFIAISNIQSYVVPKGFMLLLLGLGTLIGLLERIC